jgi:mannan endo-1,4-beta-mannosidase
MITIRIRDWFRIGAILALNLSFTACSEHPAPAQSDAAVLIDANATAETRALYQNLHRLAGEAVLFGHQDTLAYGVEWINQPEHSDIRLVTGAYPAVYGWDVGHLERGDDANLDGVNFAKMQRWIRQAFERGGVNTISWHLVSPVTGESSWEQAVTVRHIIPGGEHHVQLRLFLDRFADFASELTFTAPDGEQRLIPIIFRPWHEHNGSWFWWGKDHTDEQDYIALWRFTVEYLRDERGLRNLIYAYSPDRSRIDLQHFERDYLYGYPGDDYVDIIGIDNYWDLGHPNNEAPREQQQRDLVSSLAATARLAQARNKVAALSEGGQENLREARFWTDSLLAALLANEDTRRIVYAQVWRNANREKENRDHFFAPYPGQVSAENFIEFYRHPQVLFESSAGWYQLRFQKNHSGCKVFAMQVCEKRRCGLRHRCVFRHPYPVIRGR